MSRIKEAFAGGKAFIPFLTCGDPDLETTEAIVHAMAQAGADLIELGIPFSDPTAEGPVIQAANARALSGGVTADSIFALVRRLRRTLTLPLVFMTYANVVFSYGTERFLSAAAAAGVDGLILPDVPFEEKEEFAPLCRKYGLDLISLIAPTSAGRITQIARAAEGFVYCVSSLGVTGMRRQITTDVGAMVGPVIQAANARALSGGVTADSIFALVRRLRRTLTLPLVFMTYANVVFSYGTERFLSAAAAAGVDGLILPDVPFEEKEEFAPLCRKYGLDLISLIAPTSAGRITQIARAAEGFVYCVSSLGVTGMRRQITTDVGAMVELVRRANPGIPCAVGFGISTPEQAAAMAAVSDGAIVGSAIVTLAGRYGRDAVPAVRDYVQAMKAAVSAPQRPAEADPP